VFGIDVVTECPGLLPEILTPRNAWMDEAAYEATARKLAGLFRDDFRHYEDKVAQDVKDASLRA
jgi:phosphoenolpyruvate carboxykinase (ATP)